MNDNQASSDIDLIGLIETIWDGKWKIIVIIAACVAGAFGFRALGPAPSFIAATEIKPILAGDAEDYRQSNALGFFAIYRDSKAQSEAPRYYFTDNVPSARLDLLFLEQLESIPVLTNVLKKYKLLVREDFDSDRDYQYALTQLAATISVLPPSRAAGRRHFEVTFEYNDKDKWLAALAEIRDNANENVRNAIKAQFENLYASAEQKRAFEIEDTDAQISLLIAAYDNEVGRRLAHLIEQAAIARKLGISKQTSIPQPSIYQTPINQDAESLTDRPSRLESETPLYFRGYDALDKEIELIKARQDKRPFIDGLPKLERKKLALLNEQTPERAKRLFARTSVMRSDAFQATIFDVDATDFNYKNKRKPALVLVLAVVFGGMIGVGYVLIASAMRERRETDRG